MWRSNLAALVSDHENTTFDPVDIYLYMIYEILINTKHILRV